VREIFGGGVEVYVEACAPVVAQVRYESCAEGSLVIGC
jgi:hypothetical protein